MSAEAKTLIATNEAYRVNLRERPLGTNDVVFIFLCMTEGTPHNFAQRLGI
jgi:hypothetical protein